MSDVQLREISHSFGDSTVLSGLNLSIREGEYLVLVGRSGCGKTTLLRILAGLIRPAEGKVLFGDRDLADTPPRKRDVALVPQSDGLYPHLTVAGSIAHAIRSRVARRDRNQRITEAAAAVGIESLLDRYPEQLSGGQLRRAAVAKAIARRASVRLLDEPLSAVDAGQRFEIESDLRRLHESCSGVTLHVTHDGREAMRLADRIAVMDAGRIVQIDEPDQVYERPHSPQVAEALGNSPFHHITVSRHSGGWFASDGERVPGPDAPEGSTRLVGFYEEDQVPIEASGTERLIVESGRLAVPAKALRWFD